MTRRLEIELTSSRHDGTWTWRAAGAREPRGVIAGKLLEDGAKVGTVLRVEAEFELEGITVVSVLPARERVESQERIELAPTKSATSGLVTTSLVSHAARGARERAVDGTNRSRPRERGASARPRGETRPRTEQTEFRRPPAEREPTGRHAREGAPRRGRPVARAAHPAAGDGERARAGSAEATPARRARNRPERFTPGTRHRDEYLATLPPEQRPIAEQVAAGGMPAVRRALAGEKAIAGAAGRPVVAGEAIIALAERFLSPVRQAVWLDRAEAVIAHLDTVALRELRATVLGASPREEHGRELLGMMREALKARLAKLRASWEGDISRALSEGRVLHALRLSARPPDPGARIPSSLVQPLSEATSDALAATTSVGRWLSLLEAAAASPVRRAVKPAGLPEDPSGAVRQAAALVAGRIPALAPLLGLSMPPPPRPVAVRPAKPTGKPRAPRSRRARPKGRGGEPDGAEAPVADGTGSASEARKTPPADGSANRSTHVFGALVVEQAQLVAGPSAARGSADGGSADEVAPTGLGSTGDHAVGEEPLVETVDEV
ncbi:MAG TPA: hypothetical protein VED84_00385 [Acidimicrobiales bacterium]|nr:hypothetical protein [Acidimicrobiales bacterium]